MPDSYSVEKTPIDTTAVISNDTKVEKVDGEITENGGSVINEEDVSKVSRSTKSKIVFKKGTDLTPDVDSKCVLD